MNTQQTHLSADSREVAQLPTRRGLRVEVRAPGVSEDLEGAMDGSPAVLEFIASNERVDRYEEVIVASGWRLEAYRRNPVFQNSHQYGDILFTIGKALVTEVREGCLFQRVQFAVEVNPFARIAYGLYRGGFLNAVSVGFLPLRWEDGGPNSPWRRRYLEQELLEVSAVGVPANPDALQIGFKSGAVDRQDLRDAAELLCQMAGSFCGHTDPAKVGSCHRDDRQIEAGSSRRDDRRTARSSSVPHLNPTEPFCSLDCAELARWLKLARDIHAVMKRD